MRPLQQTTPTPTAAPTGKTDIYPDYTAFSRADAVLVYVHTVVNLRPPADCKNITASSSQGWTVQLFEADGTTPLQDHCGDGVPDVGPLGRDESAQIVVKITVPAGTPPGTVDVTTITAASEVNPNPKNNDTAVDTTTIGSLSLSVSTSSVDFGSIAPDGSTDPGATHVSGIADSLGADFVIGAADGQGAVLVTVDSDSAWTGYGRASENTGTATSISIADQRLAWRLDGTPGWTAFTVAEQSPPYDNDCFAVRTTGVSAYLFDYRLRILWTDDPGTFSSAITYSASQ